MKSWYGRYLPMPHTAVSVSFDVAPENLAKIYTTFAQLTIKNRIFAHDK